MSKENILRQKYTPILIVLVLTALIGVVGFLLPSQEEGKTPVRVLLSNSGGAVVFDHAVHAEGYGFDCADCHHEMAMLGTQEEMEATILECGACHGIDYDEAYIAQHESLFTNPFQCATCHHVQYDKTDWGHAMHMDMLDCYSCHHEDTDIEPEPQDCANCHATGYAPLDDPFPSLKNAVHQKCVDCHEDWYAEDMQGCMNCHTDLSSREKLVENNSFEMNIEQANCIACHENTTANDLILPRMDAYHGNCMGCHEDIGAGPYEPSQCKQCHTQS